jgi:serine/threonine protein kinase
MEVPLVDTLNLRPIFNTKSFSVGQKVSLSDFKFIKCLGNGGFSTVYLVRGNFDNKHYAMKLINKNFILDS